MTYHRVWLQRREILKKCGIYSKDGIQGKDIMSMTLVFYLS